MKTERTVAGSSTRLPACRKKSGGQHPLSEPDAARQPTATAYVCFGKAKLKLDADTFRVLLALLEGYMKETLSGDRTALAFYAAQETAKRMGVDDETFCRIANEIFEANDKRRKTHPFVASGFM